MKKLYTGFLAVCLALSSAGFAAAQSRPTVNAKDVNATGDVTLGGSLNLPSKAAKTVFAAPNASAGVPLFRLLVTTDIPTGTTGANIPLLSGTNVWGGSQTVGAPISSWLVGKLSGTVTYNKINAISTPSVNQGFAISQASARTSDELITGSNHNVISEAAYMLVDNTVQPHMGWARYTATEIEPTALTPQLVLGEENSVKNNGVDAVFADPFSLAGGANPAGTVMGHRVTSGWGTASNLISAYFNGNWNGGKARAGMIFGSDSLDTTSGYAPALAMAFNQGLSWYKGTGALTWRMFANSNQGDSQIVMGNNTYDMYLASSSVNPLKISTTGVGINGQTAAYPLDVNGAVRATQHLTKPGTQVLSSCGTSPSLASFSGKEGGRFTTGTGTVTACTLTFDAAFPNAAFCTVTPVGSGAVVGYITSQTAAAFTLSFTASAPGTNWQYICQGV